MLIDLVFSVDRESPLAFPLISLHPLLVQVQFP